MAKVLDARVSANLTSPPQSTAPRRIACDRCHGQKLKCPRDSEGASPCKRCAKAKAVCQTSPARATGRPAKNPKQRPRKLESSDSSSSRPSLIESNSSSSTSSTSSLDDDLLPQGVNLGPVMSHGSTSSPDALFQTPAMPSIPMAPGDSKYYPTPDMQFGFVNVVDDGYSNNFGFQYDNGTGYMCYDPPMPSVMHLDYSQQTQMPSGFTYSDTDFGVMPPPPTPPLSVVEDLHETRTHDDQKFGRRSSSTSNSSRGCHSRNASIDAFQRPSVSHSSFSSPLALDHKISEESLHTMSLPIRTMSEDESVSKKRRFSSLVSSCTPQNEMAWSSNLNHSQALSSIQFEVDSFSQNLMSQTVGSARITVSDVTIDVGELLPIAEKFIALLPQMSTNTNQSRRKGSISGFKPPTLERSQTEPDPATMEHATSESKCIDSSLMPLIFACHTRLLLAFQIAIDVISHNLSSDIDPSLNHPSSSIGSYKLTSSLSTRFHLYAIMHSLEGLEATLRKYLSPDATTATAFFDGMFCNSVQKRNEAGIHTFREQAFTEASERKDMLMTKIKHILAELGNSY